MTPVNVNHAKLGVTVHAGTLPRVPPDKPEFNLMLGRQLIRVAISAETAKKLTLHVGGGKLEGRLVEKNGNLYLIDAGFQFVAPENVKVETV
jgi:hypothetical protein